MAKYLIRVELHEVTPAGKSNTMWATKGISLKTENLHEAEEIHKHLANDLERIARNGKFIQER